MQNVLNTRMLNGMQGRHLPRVMLVKACSAGPRPRHAPAPARPDALKALAAPPGSPAPTGCNELVGRLSHTRAWFSSRA